MFKLGEYYEDDLKPLVGYLKDADFRVDIRSSLGTWTDTTAFLEGRFDELKDLVKDPERYERYLEALKSVLSSGTTPEDFEDQFHTEIDPSWKEMAETRAKYLGRSEGLSDEEKAEREDAFEKTGETIVAFDFVENILSINDIEIGEAVEEKLSNPIVRIRVKPENYDPKPKFLKMDIEIIVEKVYDVYVDEFSMPLFRDIDDDFRSDYPDEYLKVLVMGLLIEDLVEKPSQGKIDLKSFADRCQIEMGGGDEFTLAIDASDVAEEIAKVLEKNGVIKIKGSTIKWKA